MTLFHSIFARKSLRVGGLLIAAAWVFASAHDSRAADKNLDPVVAIVNGFKIHMSDVSRARQQLPPQAQQYPIGTIYNFLLNNLVNTRLVAAAARKEGLDKQDYIVKQIRRIEE